METENIYRVYIHINRINQKVYVGQTKERNINKRWGNNGIGYKSQPRFWRAIQKYGWDNFDHFVITDWITKEKADKIEIAVIKLFNSTNKECGYNVAQGGNGATGVPCSEEKKELLSKMFGGKGNPFYGKKHTDNVKKLLSELHSIPVVQLDMDGLFITEYKNAKYASEITGADYSSIIKCCMEVEHFNSAGGYLWMYKSDYDNGEIKKYINNHLRPVVQLNKLGNFISEYPSIKIASKETNVCDTNIVMCCNDVYQSAGGFLWKYKENYDPNDNIVYKDTRIRSVIQFDIYGNIINQYKSIKEAEQKTGIHSSNIIRCCLYDANTAGGFVWRYADKEYSIEEIINKKYLKKSQQGPILQFDLNMNFIKEYKNIAHAVKITGISKSSISRCCRGEQDSAGGFIWIRKSMYKEELNELQAI